MRVGILVMIVTAAFVPSFSSVGLCDEAAATSVVCPSEATAVTAQGVYAPGWRVGVMWGQPTSNQIQDDFGSAGGLTVEYSVAGSRRQETSVFLSYQRMRTGEDDWSGGYEYGVTRASGLPNYGWRQQVDVVVLGLKRRFGPGARLNSEGLYAGVGLGLACSHFYESDYSYGPYDESYDSYVFKPSLSASVGANFSKNLYAEATYVNPGEFYHTSYSTFGITMGARF